jgi:hypothetical protein
MAATMITPGKTQMERVVQKLPPTFQISVAVHASIFSSAVTFRLCTMYPNSLCTQMLYSYVSEQSFSFFYL